MGSLLLMQRSLRPHMAFSHNTKGVARYVHPVRAASGKSEDLGENVQRIAKKIQGSLPIIGLLSRLVSPEGGFDEMSYPEFCRSVFEENNVTLGASLTDMEKAHGKYGNSRWLLLMLWMAKHGVGLVPTKDILNSAKRLRITQDIEMEMDRFEGIKAATLQKYKLMERPQASMAEQLAVAVDSISILCFGLKEGEPLPDGDARIITAFLVAVFKDASQKEVAHSITGRSSRGQAPT